VPCAARGTLFLRYPEETRPIAVGDVVEVDLATEPGSVEERHPRRTVLFRAAGNVERRAQVLVANADAVLVVSSVRQPVFRPQGADRVLAAAAQAGLDSILCLNKVDLARAGEVERLLGPYLAFGCRTIATSASRGDGVDALREALSGRVTVLAGVSGAGKSSLLNAVEPGLGQRVAAVSKKTGEGRHTTTAVEMLPLRSGGDVVDTPGIRGFSLWKVEPREIGHFFAEFQPFLSQCRYVDCRHEREPGCAVVGAIASGAIARSRHASYLALLREAVESESARSVEGKREGRRTGRASREDEGDEDEDEDEDGT